MTDNDRGPQRSLCDVHEKQLGALETAVFGSHDEGLLAQLISVRTTLGNLQEALRERFESVQRAQRTMIGVLVSIGLLFVGGFVTAVYALLAR